ncbi:PPK2 family polyphosphate kinase [Salinicoccus halitifaciens]|uniref:PPK2 family polyphosphate:nucleotide phosphotransferase n=1 Tax=Salinicoccus halitifaciens TaxID=1073415 RepID=A0ABV2EA37_9STAP|nr:PPK2 family polyphosphate kinase [Salinicoccus halitifaciens]MCD2138403.1 polyphosphate--nucleotide phosphotransferase [Salinicoccus halitifaciens]
MKINTDDYKVVSNESFTLKDYSSKIDPGLPEGETKERIIPELVKQLKEWHLKLFAEEKAGIMVVLQALDAAGKDEAISFVFSNLNAQGLRTMSFSKPSEEERKHDYLWRMHAGTPERGEVSLLNRSYYEEVIYRQVHEDLEEDEYPADTEPEDIWAVRYRQINDYERYLHENNMHIIKFFFNVSKDEQKERLLKRMKTEDRQWEFSFNDVKEREHWDEYQEVFQDVLSETASEHAPWYVLPADNHWYSRAVIAKVMIEKLEEINPEFPTISEDQKAELDEYIEKLENE